MYKNSAIRKFRIVLKRADTAKKIYSLLGGKEEKCMALYQNLF